MSLTYAIRRFVTADFDAVAALAVEASASPDTACGQPDVASSQEFEADYGHRPLETEAWVAEADGRVVGFAAGQARNGIVLVDGPIVAASKRRLGIGTALFAAVEADARQAGATAVEGGVRATNTHGAVFLDAHGYMPHREIFVYEADKRLDAPFLLPEGYTLADLKPRFLLAFLMVMHECFPGYRLPSTPQRLFEPDKMKIVLILDPEGEVAGAATAFYYPEDGLGYVYHLGISEPHRRIGLAHSLLSSACEWLWESHEPRVIGISTADAIGVRNQLFAPLGFALRYSLRYLRKDVAP